MWKNAPEAGIMRKKTKHLGLPVRRYINFVVSTNERVIIRGLYQMIYFYSNSKNKC